MQYEGMILEKDDSIATLTLNRPEQLNAITRGMILSLCDALSELEKDEGIKALIVTGAGRGFAAGLDASALSDLSSISPEELREEMRIFVLSLYNFTKPAIAAINGVTAGAGLALTLLCDIRIASEEARFFSGYNRMGLTPDIGMTYYMPRLVGLTRAMELLLLGDPFDAAEALKMGIVNRVVPADALMNVTLEIAARIASGPSVAVNLTKQALRKSFDSSIEQQVDVEFSTFSACLKTEDHLEGLSAFREKRSPEFKGR